MKTPTKDEIPGAIIGYTIVALLTGLLLLWYNHLLCATHLAYWQFVLLSLPVLWAGYCFKWFARVMGFLIIVAFTVQLCAWMAIWKVPLIH